MAKSALDKVITLVEKGTEKGKGGVRWLTGGIERKLEALGRFLEGLGYEKKPVLLTKYKVPKPGRLQALLRTLGGGASKIAYFGARHPGLVLGVGTLVPGVIASYLILRKLMKKD